MSGGRFFEDFRPGEEIVHATPRTITEGDRALATALYGGRFAIHSADTFAAALGLPRAPIEDTLAFNIVFGKTVPDISLNAVANLGYAEGVFGAALYPGDTISARSTVIGLKENANRQTGIVHVRTVGLDQRGAEILSYVRWVMVRKRDPAAPAPALAPPPLAAAVPAERLVVPPGLDLARYDFALAGSARRWGDYAPGERIDHVDGVTIEEAEHQLATRLYQNAARVHFNQFAESGGRFGRRLVYGGHVIALARALSFNGLENAFRIAAINAGTHASPVFAGDTIFAWTEVVERLALPGRSDLGALRLVTRALKNRPCADYPALGADGKRLPELALELDYTALMPR